MVCCQQPAPLPDGRLPLDPSEKVSDAKTIGSISATAAFTSRSASLFECSQHVSVVERTTLVTQHTRLQV